MCLAFPVNRFLPRPPGPVPKRRLEIQQSQAVWELNNQHPDAEIRRDRTAIQTAGAVSRGPEQQNVEKEAFHTRPGPRPLPWPPPHPAPLGSQPAPNRGLAPASAPAGRSPGLPGLWSKERGAGHVQKGQVARSQDPASGEQRPPPSPATPLQAPRPGTRAVAWSCALSGLRPLRAAPGRRGAGSGNPATLTQESTSPRRL